MSDAREAASIADAHADPRASMQVRCPRCLGLMVPENHTHERVVCSHCGPGRRDANVYYLPKRLSTEGGASLACARCERPLAQVSAEVQSCAHCATRHVIPTDALPPLLAAKLADPKVRTAHVAAAEQRKKGWLWLSLLLLTALLFLLMHNRG